MTSKRSLTSSYCLLLQRAFTLIAWLRNSCRRTNTHYSNLPLCPCVLAVFSQKKSSSKPSYIFHLFQSSKNALLFILGFQTHRKQLLNYCVVVLVIQTSLSLNVQTVCLSRTSFAKQALHNCKEPTFTTCCSGTS